MRVRVVFQLVVRQLLPRAKHAPAAQVDDAVAWWPGRPNTWEVTSRQQLLDAQAYIHTTTTAAITPGQLISNTPNN